MVRNNPYVVNLGFLLINHARSGRPLVPQEELHQLRDRTLPDGSAAAVRLVLRGLRPHPSILRRGL